MVVVLIGASSNVGKTTAARDVARRLGAADVSIDDHIPAELATSSPFRDEMIWNLEREDLLAALRAQTAQLWPVVSRLVDEVMASDRAVIIEGQGIEPRIGADRTNSVVRSVFVVEESVDQLRATLAARDSAGGVRYRGLPEDAQRAVAIMNADYAQWIRAEAESNRQPWISSQPWSTLAARVIDAAGLA